MKIFENYDHELLEIPASAQTIRDSMIAGSEWTTEDGDFPGHFKNRVPHGCIWTCVWSTRTFGQLDPKLWYPLETMTVAELTAEAADMVGQAIGDMANLSTLLTAYLLGNVASPEPWLTDVKKLLRVHRCVYSNYTCKWDKSLDAMWSLWRPHWPAPAKPPQHRAPKQGEVQTTENMGNLEENIPEWMR